LIVIGLIAIIVASSLIVYENGLFTPQELQLPTSPPWQRPIENFATGIAAADGKVFTIDIWGNINCYDAQSGKSLWNGSIGGYFASGITVSGGKVYGGTNGAEVGCLNEETGKFQWSFNALFSDLYFKKPPNSIIVQDGLVIAISDGVSVHNATTEKLLWQATSYAYSPSLGILYGNITDLNTWWAAGFPLGGDPFDGNIVYALGGNFSGEYVFKLNTDNGAILWRSNIASLNGITSVLATYQGQVIIENGNQILSLDDASGDILWSINVGASIYQPAVYNGLLLFGASNGNFYALNMADGAIAWKTKVDSQNLFALVNSNNFVTTSPIQVDPQNQQIYWSFAVTQQLGTSSGNVNDQYNGTLCSLDLATGNVTWTQQINDSGAFSNTPIGLAFNDNTVFLTENYALWMLNASTGNLIKSQQFDHYILPPIVLGNETFVAADLYLIALS